MPHVPHFALPAAAHSRPVTFLRDVAGEWSRVDGVHLAASLAFYSVLSLTPFLLVIVAIAGWLLGSDQASRFLFTQIADIAGARTAHFVQSLVAGSHPEASEQGARAIIGLAVTLAGATATFAELKHGLDRVFGTRHKGAYAFVRTRVLAFALVVGVAVLAIGSLFLSTAVQATLADVAHADVVQAMLGAVANEVVTFVMLALAFGAILRVLPECPPTRRAVWTGAVAAALLFAIGRFVIGWYLARFALSSPYGAAGAIVVVMLWIYWTSALFFVGAVVARVRDHPVARRPS